jgi:hypothetical protein
MDTAAKGDDEALKAGYAKIGKEMPKPVATNPTVGGSLKNYGHEVIENTGEVLTGMADRTAKAGRFVKQTGKDLVERLVGKGEEQRPDSRGGGQGPCRRQELRRR